jgi:hypothetical protein
VRNKAVSGLLETLPFQHSNIQGLLPPERIL